MKVVLKSFHMNGDRLGLIHWHLHKSLHVIISTTWKYSSIVLIWIVLHAGVSSTHFQVKASSTGKSKNYIEHRNTQHHHASLLPNFPQLHLYDHTKITPRRKSYNHTNQGKSPLRNHIPTAFNFFYKKNNYRYEGTVTFGGNGTISNCWLISGTEPVIMHRTNPPEAIKLYNNALLSRRLSMNGWPCGIQQNELLLKLNIQGSPCSGDPVVCNKTLSHWN